MLSGPALAMHWRRRDGGHPSDRVGVASFVPRVKGMNGKNGKI